MNPRTDEKKKSWALSLTSTETTIIEERVSRHGFKDRNEYVLALVEADVSLGLEAALHPETKLRILKLSSGGLEKVLEDAQRKGVINDPLTAKYVAELVAAELARCSQKKGTLVTKIPQSKAG